MDTDERTPVQKRARVSALEDLVREAREALRLSPSHTTALALQRAKAKRDAALAEVRATFRRVA